MHRYTYEKAGVKYRVVDNGVDVPLTVGVYKSLAAAMRNVEKRNDADHTARFMTCSRCGQASITRAETNVCGTCQARERRTQGEAMRLFAPAPNQIQGQLTL